MAMGINKPDEDGARKPTILERKDMLTKKSNYLLVELSYSTKVVLPYADGIALMIALENAELYTNRGDYTRIEPLQIADTIETKVISEQQYLDLKMTKLLGVEVKTI